jgi:hypothetical protein
MALLDAVIKAGVFPANGSQSEKKRFAEILSKFLAEEVADGLRQVGFPNVKPFRGAPGEKAFQGGLGTKKVDVSYSDDQHGLMLAVSIKSIVSPPFGKNLKNRFGDLCTEAITLHMRFPYSVIGMLFAFPGAADIDTTKVRRISTFRRAGKLFSTISGRRNYTDPGEKFETITMMLFHPITSDEPKPALKLFEPPSMREIKEEDYFTSLRDVFDERNPHVFIGEEEDEDVGEFGEET